jgi:hypothetical protein
LTDNSTSTDPGEKTTASGEIEESAKDTKKEKPKLIINEQTPEELYIETAILEI